MAEMREQPLKGATLDEEVLIRKTEGRIAVLTLNRPDSLNALNSVLMRELLHHVRAVAEDDSVKCVVLTGAGEGFCSGGDVRAINKAASERVAGPTLPKSATEVRARWLRRNAEASRLLHEMPKPTIAMINGACAGAGLSLAAACDFRYASDSAKFRPAFASNGLPGDYGGSWLWTRILGPAKARQLYLLDDKRDAQSALEFGLVDCLFPHDSLYEEVFAIAQRLADLPGAGVAYAKANLNAAMMENFSASLDRESLAMMLARNVLVENKRLGKASVTIAGGGSGFAQGEG